MRSYIHTYIYVYTRTRYIWNKQIIHRRREERKSVRSLFFKLHFAQKNERTLRWRGRRVASIPPFVIGAVDVVWQCLFFSFSYFSCSLSAPLGRTHRHTLNTSSSSARPLDVACGNNNARTAAAAAEGSFLKVSFWFWRWQIHSVLSSVVRHRRPRIYIYIFMYI